jgi:hypothetical protein
MPVTLKLIEAKTLSSNQETVIFTGIPATYTDLLCVNSIRGSQGSVNESYFIYFNGDDTSRTGQRWYGTGTTVEADSSPQPEGVGNTATANVFSNEAFYIYDYRSTTGSKFWTYESGTSTNGTNGYQIFGSGKYSPATSAAITSITFDGNSSTTLLAGSTLYLYGILKF